MAIDTGFPTSPFYILSKDKPYEALGYFAFAGTLNLLEVSKIPQFCLWYSAPTGGTGSILVNASSGLVITLAANKDFPPASGTQVGLTALPDKPPGDYRAGNSFIAVPDGSGFYYIRSAYASGLYLYTDSSGSYACKVGAQGNSGLFEFVAENGTFDYKSISYDTLDSKGNQKQGAVVPNYVSTAVVDNSNGSNSLTANLSFSYETSTTVSYTQTHEETSSTSVTNKIGVSGVIEEILTVSDDLTIEHTETTSTTSSQEEAQTNATTQTAQVTVTVPAGLTQTFALKINQGVIDPSLGITYKLSGTLASSVPGLEPYSIEFHGLYSGSNTVSVEIENSSSEPGFGSTYQLHRITPPKLRPPASAALRQSKI